MASKGQIVGTDWNRIARLHSHVLAIIVYKNRLDFGRSLESGLRSCLPFPNSGCSGVLSKVQFCISIPCVPN